MIPKAMEAYRFIMHHKQPLCRSFPTEINSLRRPDEPFLGWKIHTNLCRSSTFCRRAASTFKWLYRKRTPWIMC